jgi:ankyrin repeat protein
VEALISHGSSATRANIVSAAESGHADVVKLLIRRYNEENGRSILHLLPGILNPDSVYSGNACRKRAVDIIIGQCQDELNQASKDGNTPIVRAITASSAYITSALISAGATVPDEHLFPALLLTIRSSRNDLAAALLARDPATLASSGDAGGCTALHAAVGRRPDSTTSNTVTNGALVSALLEAGANPNIPDNLGKTPLFYAGSVEIVNKLLDAGADMDHRDNDGCSPLLWTEHAEVAAALLRRGVDVEGRGRAQQTVLMKAAAWKDASMLRCLLERADVLVSLDDRDELGRTALAHAAAASDSVDIVKALIDAGANVHRADNINRTPLHNTVNCDVIRLLLESGADLHTEDLDGSWTMMVSRL